MSVIHVDGYRMSFEPPPYKWLRRWDDPEEFPQHVKLTGESYWNGYVFCTAPHEGDECAAHDPNPGEE